MKLWIRFKGADKKPQNKKPPPLPKSTSIGSGSAFCVVQSPVFAAVIHGSTFAGFTGLSGFFAAFLASFSACRRSWRELMVDWQSGA
jgi:hypothetical protein